MVDFPTPWPVGNGLGVDGTDVVETYFPLHTLPSPPRAMRFGFDSDDGLGGMDTILTTDGQSNGPAIVVILATITEIPTLSTVSLALLSLLIAAAAWRVLRRRPGATWVILIMASSLVAVSIFATGVILLDGDPSDWAGADDASADDPFGDAPPTADLRAAFVALDPAGTYLYMRLDAARGTPPTAEDDAATVTEDDPPTTIDVLANETNPDGFPLTITNITTPPANGTVAITNAGADLTYEPDPDFCNDGTPTDDFVYELNNDTTATVAMTVTCVDDAPTITGIADQTIVEDTSTGPLPFTIGDVDTAVGSLIVTATSSDQALIPDANLVLAGAPGANRTITATPAAGQSGGPVTITITVDDGTTAVPTTFGVTVTADEDPPTITAIADQTINEDGTTGALAFTIGDPDTPIASLIVTATSSDQTLIPDANLTLGGAPTANRTITAVPAANENGGPVTVTVTVDDGTTAVNETFDITVTPVDDPPTITAIADQTINEDGTTGALAFTIDDIDTAIGSLIVTAGSNDQTLIPDANLALAGAPGANRTITATPAADENGGPATITITVDDGTTAVPETFDVTVTAVDDPPTITAIADQNIDEDGNTGALAFTIDDIDTAIASLIVTAGSNDQTLIPDANLALAGAPAANRTITATPAADENGGPATITVTVDDGTTAVPETFDVTVMAINDEPTFTAGANQSVAEDAPAQTVAGWATGIDDGDPEVVQTLTFMVTNNNNGLFSVQPDVDEATGTLTFTPAADASGMATVSVTLMDNGGTVNPGDDDTSPTSMFTITVNSVNDAPTHTPGGGIAAFTEGMGAVVVDSAIVVADIDDVNLESATLTLGILDAGQETLAATTGGTSIVAMYNGGTGVLSLTGSDTVANYQTVLRSVTYNNSSAAPSTTNRTITCVVNDGDDDQHARQPHRVGDVRQQPAHGDQRHHHLQRRGQYALARGQRRSRQSRYRPTGPRGVVPRSDGRHPEVRRQRSRRPDPGLHAQDRRSHGSRRDDHFGRRR